MVIAALAIVSIYWTVQEMTARDRSTYQFVSLALFLAFSIIILVLSLVNLLI